MDDFLLRVILIIVIAVTPFTIYMAYEHIGTHKLLKKHQDEWDTIKSELKRNGATPCELSEAYKDYIADLWVQRHPIFGACFPRE